MDAQQQAYVRYSDWLVISWGMILVALFVGGYGLFLFATSPPFMSVEKIHPEASEAFTVRGGDPTQIIGMAYMITGVVLLRVASRFRLSIGRMDGAAAPGGGY